ncbi:N-acetylglucosamine kinase [Actinospica durhamensis]|uniref:N-acetylglucosamine kinase n=1 Tax=Actinospica durhamensis TaxID=1508375 RepID=A0A941IU50_9ACTN|nr:BadF/BadG/BcrA/BcrD ATPase family protein [Actinospica durhamensis]MBR7838587.1 N-acetylglucosamine kinase [Actinospica durhamensis]
MTARLVLGLDVGGTSTRALAVDAVSGERLGSGRAPGANPVAHGVGRAAENIAAALKEALAGRDPADVHACVVGLAGASKVAADPGTAAEFARLWLALGLGCEVAIVSDAAAAFAAGTPEPDGSVLVAGTGAVAAAVAGRRPWRWRDGHGWLLGDDGSGFWIGRQAARAALAALDASGPAAAPPAAGPLVESVLATYLDTESADDAPVPAPVPARLRTSALIAAVTARPPVNLAALVPCVLDAADAGDEVAAGILAEAARHLTSALGHVREPAATTPIVLAGGLLHPGTRVDRLVRRALAAAWPDAPIRAAIDGAAGAAWLAALPIHPPDRARDLHARLTQLTAE